MARFASPKHPDLYPDRPIDCQVSIDDAFREMWENIAAAGWGPEEIAGALYELTDNHLTALRENDSLDRWLAKGQA
ncbi:hypothetical protein SAMN04488498_1295 [Mesorhizobium albiziae]|uniref:Uncharacterized protein n=1 Tax=Neomesorhizobium albiziae TaxID=335020 RepID=A0A1I4EQE4_9HYPH|nr:hypothetical protein [Mesorhizobium albiziae]GLS30733.1 hypothetical protein GCM10007937_24410 [Mesorhizobium albiziae]SFL07433.1 hypothetical protein SAMN04488498_1295 [Mesorhizobium albiziae]